MASKQPPKTKAAEAGAATKLQEAQAKLKAATERHDAIVSVMSRLRSSPQERRLAQSESKKVERELQDAKRLVSEAEAAANGAKAGGAS